MTAASPNKPNGTDLDVLKTAVAPAQSDLNGHAEEVS